MTARHAATPALFPKRHLHFLSPLVLSGQPSLGTNTTPARSRAGGPLPLTELPVCWGPSTMTPRPAHCREAVLCGRDCELSNGPGVHAGKRPKGQGLPALSCHRPAGPRAQPHGLREEPLVGSGTPRTPAAPWTASPAGAPRGTQPLLLPTQRAGDTPATPATTDRQPPGDASPPCGAPHLAPGIQPLSFLFVSLYPLHTHTAVHASWAAVTRVKQPSSERRHPHTSGCAFPGQSGDRNPTRRGLGRQPGRSHCCSPHPACPIPLSPSPLTGGGDSHGLRAVWAPRAVTGTQETLSACSWWQQLSQSSTLPRPRPTDYPADSGVDTGAKPSVLWDSKTNYNLV